MPLSLKDLEGDPSLRFPKKKPFDDPRNYRPLRKNILQHIHANNISKEEFGFLKGRSGETAVLSSLNNGTERQ